MTMKKLLDRTMTTIKHYLYLCIFILFSTTLFGQSNDFMVWQTLSFDKKINKKNHFELSQKIRIKDNSSHLYKFILQIAWNHSITKAVAGEIYYRYIVSEPFDNREFGHRFNAGMTFEKKVNHFKLSWCTRLQSTYVMTGSDFFESESYNRNKLSLKYARKNDLFSPFIKYEFFFPVDNYVVSNISEVRYEVGTQVKINKTQDFSIYYGWIHLYDKRIPENLYILGIKYSVDL